MCEYGVTESKFPSRVSKGPLIGKNLTEPLLFGSRFCAVFKNKSFVFKPDYKWIARQLGITPLQVKSAINRLRRLEILKTKGRKWVKTRQRFQFPTTSSQEAVSGFHREMIYKAITTLENRTPSDFEAR